MTDPIKPFSQNVWIFLRGLMREAAHWGPFVDHFRRAFPYTNVLTPDLPGAGAHHLSECPACVAGMTPIVRESVRGEIEAARAEGRGVYLLAFSLGGMVALDWMSRYPDDFAGAVLCNTSAGGISPFYHRMRPSVLPKLLRAAREKDPIRKELISLSFIANRTETHAETARWWADIARERPISAKNGVRQLRAAAGFRAPAGPLKSKLLVLTSRGDKMVNPASSRAVAEKYGAPVHENDWCGHEISADDPDWLIAQIRSWLENPSAK